MTWRLKDPNDPALELLCVLHWPEPHSYYLSRRYNRCWDLWVHPHSQKHAEQLIGRLCDPETSDREVGKDLLREHLGRERLGEEPTRQPELGLLSSEDLGEALMVLAAEARIN